MSLTLGFCDGYTALLLLAGVAAYFPVHASLTLHKWSLYLSGKEKDRAVFAVSADGSSAASVSTLTQLRQTTLHELGLPARCTRSIRVK